MTLMSDLHPALNPVSLHDVPHRAWSHVFWRGLLALAVLYGLVITGVWWGQESLLFKPVRLPERPTASLPDGVQEHWVSVDGARLNARYLRLPHPRGVVLYLHGNGGNLDTWFTGLEFYRAANVELFMVDYRGYGKSSGRIESEAQLKSDVRAVWSHLHAQRPDLPMAIIGRSLGTGLAADLAITAHPRLTVLIAPYLSMVQMAREQFAWVPSGLLRYPLATDLTLPQVAGPVLLLHGSRDALIPVEHSQALVRLAPGAQLQVVDGAGHGDIHQFEVYRRTLRTALDAAMAPPAAGVWPARRDSNPRPAA
jgi:uncharacterized protein